MPYAIFGFTTPNLGDDVQALAAALLLPQVDAYVDRDNLDKVKLSEPHQLIMNSWFAIKRHKAVPSDSVIPHYFGQCVGNPKILNSVWLNEWKKRAPIGCRDTYSVDALTERGISAFFSGCLTTWMGRFFKPPEKREGIVFVDVPEQIEKFIPQNVRDRATRITNFISTKSLNQIERFKKTAELCDIVRTAEAVVTRRLHTALPCVGFGTPVTVYLEGSVKNRRRFSGMDRFLPISFHDGESIVEGEQWIEPVAVNVPSDLEAGFNQLLNQLGSTAEPRYDSVVDFVNTLPSLPREPRSIFKALMPDRENA